MHTKITSLLHPSTNDTNGNFIQFFINKSKIMRNSNIFGIIINTKIKQKILLRSDFTRTSILLQHLITLHVITPN